MGSLRYLQASDIHGMDELEAVVSVINSRGDLDAAFFNGDLVDGWQYNKLAKEESKSIEEAQLKLNERIIEGLSKEEQDALGTVLQFQQFGGIHALKEMLDHESDPKLVQAIEELIDRYDSHGPAIEVAEQRLNDIRHDDSFFEEQKQLQQLAEQIETQVESKILDRVKEEAKKIDNIFSGCTLYNADRSKNRMYTVDGNHDGPILREVKTATRLEDLAKGLTLNGVTFAGEANTREMIPGMPESFYAETHSMQTTDPTTQQMYALTEQYLAQHGDAADVHAFRRQILSKNPIYRRLAAMETIDVLMLHNPVGQNAYVKQRTKDGQSQNKYIDYSFAVDQIIREKQPSVIGWGHVHGEFGDIDDTDQTFGYQFQGVHTTDEKVFVIDLDTDSKNINWIDVYKMVREQSPDNN